MILIDAPIMFMLDSMSSSFHFYFHLQQTELDESDNLDYQFRISEFEPCEE